MGRSAFISAALHAAILLWIIVILPGSRPLDAPPVKEIPVDLVTPSAVTSIKAGAQDAKSEKALAPKPQPKAPTPAKIKAPNTPAPKQASAPPPPPPVPAPTPKKPAPETPKPEKSADAKPAPKLDKAPDAPKPSEDKTADSEPPPTLPLHRPPPPKLRPKPRPKPKPSLAANSKDSSDTDRISALLNKMPDAGGGPSTDKPAKETENRVHGQSNGTQLSLSVDEIDALRQRISQCWNPPPGGLGAGHIVIKLHMKLNQDGTLVGQPTVENSDPSPFFQAAADAAVRAVFQCQPYTLPAEKYSLWSDMILNFDPSQMYSAG